MCGQSFMSRYARKTKMNTNTQIVEASNRCTRRSIQKRVTFSRNFPVRSHSAAHNINHGRGESIYLLCRVVGSSISPGTRVSRALKQQQKINDCHKRRKKTKTYIDKRSRKRRALFKLYETHQEEVMYHKMYATSCTALCAAI